MFRSLLRLTAPLAAIAILWMTPVAVLADSVSYYTTGQFSSPSVLLGGNVATVENSGQSLKIANGANSVTLSFLGVGTLATPIIQNPLPVFDEIMASFSLAFTGTSTGVNFTAVTDVANFLLTIHQTSPLGTGTSGGDVLVTGRVRAANSPGHFNIDLSTNPVVIGTPSQTVTYKFTNLNATKQLEITSNPTVLLADISSVSAVPLPPAVWGGLSLMGLMGAKGLRRKQLLNAGE